MNVLDAIKERHSYRGQFRSDPVPREDLITVIRFFRYAPTPILLVPCSDAWKVHSASLADYIQSICHAACEPLPFALPISRFERSFLLWVHRLLQTPDGSKRLQAWWMRALGFYNNPAHAMNSSWLYFWNSCIWFCKYYSIFIWFWKFIVRCIIFFFF